MRDLITFYRDRFHLFNERNEWLRILTKKCDESLISSLLDECRASIIQTPHDYLLILKKIAVLSFLSPSESVQDVLKQVYANGFWEDFQLGQALYALTSHFLGLPISLPKPKSLPKGGILVESGHHLPDGGIPHLLINAEIALIWIYLGWTHKDDVLLHAGLKWTHFAAALFDHKNRPFHGIWSRESEYDPVTFLSLYSFLFSVSFKILDDQKIKQASDALFDQLKEVEEDSFKNPPYFPYILMEAFEKLSKKKKHPEISETFTISEFDKDLGFLSYRQDEASFACTYSGVNTGIGALHKNEVRIVSFGPHFLPLADSDRYGVYRCASISFESFRDLAFEKDDTSFEVQGWTRLISPFSSEPVSHHFTRTQPGRQWLFFSASQENQKIIFQSRLSEIDEKHPLYFVYFVLADKAHIQGKTFVPGTLKRYQGSTSEIVFEKGKEKLSLTSESESEMFVIPLAGKRHFWSADFLLAYPFNNQNPSYSWSIA